MKYKLTASGVKDTERNMFIPNSAANRHWRQYQEWVAEGNEPDPEFTAEELEAKELASTIADLEKDLVGTDRLLLKLVVRLATVLIMNGTLTKADIGAQYVSGAITLKEKLDTLEANL